MKNRKESCLETPCLKSKNYSLNELLVSPFEVGSADIYKLFAFFLYSAPDIESVHSKKIPSCKHSDIFCRMMDNRHFKYHKGYLNGEIICLKCKRFVCKKKKTKKGMSTETDLDCFLRHIRNSIAHGRVYYSHEGNRIHIVFEDENSTGKLSARIVCIKADLEHWKRILSNLDIYR